MPESDASDLTAEIGKATEWLEQLSNFMTDTSDLTSSSSSDSDSVSQFLLFFFMCAKRMDSSCDCRSASWARTTQTARSCHAVAMQLPCTIWPCHCSHSKIRRAVAMQLPCSSHAVAMQLPCICHAFAMRFACSCHAVAMRLQCFCHAVAMQLPCSCHAAPG